MTNVDFAPEGALELWKFGQHGGRLRVAQNVEPDEAVRMCERFNLAEEQTRQMRTELQMPEPPGGPFEFRIVEYVETRTVWDP